MNANCGTCGFPLWELPDTYRMCKRCDTSNVGGGYRHGPPNSPGTTDGRFTAPFGDNK